MNKWTLLAMVAAVGLGCGKGSSTATADGGYAAELQMAEATWASAKPSCPEYHYQALTSSVFGLCSETTIEIAKDQPVQRSYLFTSYGTCGSADAGFVETWDEIGAQQVGTHADGAPALTVEQLFASCQTSLAQDPSANTIALTIGTDGVPTRCGYTPINCEDDCSEGFQLSDFTCGPWPTDGGGVDAPD